MKTEKFNEFINKINESSNKINDPRELIKKSEDYIENTDILCNKWIKNFYEIINDNEAYRSISYSLDVPIQDIETERGKVKLLIDNTKIFLNRMDRKFKKEGDLSDDDNDLYYDLEISSEKLTKVLGKMKELRNEIKSVSKDYINLDESFDYIRHFKIEI